MEDVISLYTEEGEADPRRPYVCFDETSKQLVAETRQPLPPRPGKLARFDYEYERRGTANVFLRVAPRLGWRQVNVTARRTRVDFALQMRALVDEYFPRAEVVRVVLDNLNTHSPASLYEAFAPAEAKRILDRLEFHHTPRHGSWLNMAELELSILGRQCLKARVPDAETLRADIAAWQTVRNADHARLHWAFRVEDARKKLHRLYPSPSA
jgi:hypothetical protein